MLRGTDAPVNTELYLTAHLARKCGTENVFDVVLAEE